MPEVDDVPDLDRYIGAEVLLPKEGASKQAEKIVSRVLNKDGNPVGAYNRDPLLDTRVYEVMFPDGTIQQYASNLIVEEVMKKVEDTNC